MPKDMQAENQMQNSENPKSETRKQKIEKSDLILLGNRNDGTALGTDKLGGQGACDSNHSDSRSRDAYPIRKIYP